MNLTELLKKLRLPFLILFIFYACTSEQDHVEGTKNIQVEPLTISGAQAWYNQYFRTAPRLKSSDSEDEVFPAMEPDWSLAELSADSLWYVVEMPVVTEEHKGIYMMGEEVSRYVSEKGDKSLAKQLLRMVVMRNKEDGKTYSFMMAVLPDLGYMLKKGESIDENKYLTRDSDLSGLVFYYNIDGSFVNGWVYKDGKITGGTHSAGGGQPRQKAVTGIIIEYCWYQDAYVQKPDGTLVYINTTFHCHSTIYYTGHDNDSIFADGEGGVILGPIGGGGSGGGGQNPRPGFNYRDIGNITADEIVKSAMNTMMTNVKKDASAENGRRERGFWVFYDEATGKYYAGVEKIGPYAQGEGTHGSVTAGSAHPLHNGSHIPSTAIPVAFAHGHTPLTFEDAGLSRPAGLSDADRDWSRDNNLPIIAIDYVGQPDDNGVNYVHGGHGINDETKAYIHTP